MKKNKNYKMSQKLAAAVTVGMLSGANGAWAGGAIDANDLTKNLIESSRGFTDMMSLLGYVGGSGFALAGIYKLKQHVDNPGQTPMKDGVMRLAAGGALLTLPFITTVMQGSVGQGDGTSVDQGKVKLGVFE